mgnify:CR=1 FL=1
MNNLPFRLGTTSYIIPADILPNVRYLAGKVRDIELILFEVDDGPNNLPTPAVVDELLRLAALYDLSYTVHLPLDLKLAADGSARDVSLDKARRVIECTRALRPWAYVLHLDGKAVRHSTDPAVLRPWQDRAVRALELVAAWAGGPEKLAVENLEGYPPAFNEPVLERIPVGCCVDIGHLCLDGHDPLPYLQAWLPRARVIHWHGVADRDHAGLHHVAPAQLDAVLAWLYGHYRGVLTLEVFNEADLEDSLTALQAGLARLAARPGPSSRLTLLLGGARSGKSAWALELARRHGGEVLFVATATAGDEEMRMRIAAHRAERPAHWRTLEAPYRVAEAITQALRERPADVVILDCLTLLTSNLLVQEPGPTTEAAAAAAVLAEVEALLACWRAAGGHWIVISNEVGMGLVPPYPLGRLFRDVLGRANQRLAAAADETLFLVAGKPIRLA